MPSAKKLKIKNWKLAFGRISKIILYCAQEIPPPLGGMLGGGLESNEEFRIKNEEFAFGRITKKLKIENWKLKISLRQRYKEIEARSPTDASLLAIGSLSLGKVPKRLKGARSTKPNNDVLAQSLLDFVLLYIYIFVCYLKNHIFYNEVYHKIYRLLLLYYYLCCY